MDEPRTLEDYIDDAKTALSLPSDRQLAFHLGVNSTAVSQWRTRRTYPSPASMVLLAISGAHDPEVALLDLGTWTTPPDTAAFYQTIKRKLSAVGRSAAVFLAGLSALLLPGEAAATPLVAPYIATGLIENSVTFGYQLLYIMENKARALNAKALRLISTAFSHTAQRLAGCQGYLSIP